MFRKILVVVIILTGIISLYSDERGLTCRDLAEPVNPTGLQATPWQGGAIEISRHAEELNREGWELADSVNIDTFLPAGDRISIEYSGTSHQMTVESLAGELSAEVQDAIDRAPGWIRAELETTLGLLDDELQIFWANVINEVDDPIIDEVAFCIATASDVYLSSDWAYPELYIQNAEMIYEYDQELNYVEVIDYGNSVTDENYYSTTRYWNKSANGIVHQVEVPREIYYWYIVHPKITDEIPAFITPNVLESNSTHDTNIVGPEEGYFWREFLYNYADEGYPILRDYLIQCEYANDFTSGYASAIGACTQWLGQSLVFTSDYERPHQPVRIYRKHIGRCGEHADMRVAIGRIALVPMTSIVCFTVDHTWNEFWDEEWIHWDGGSINSFYMYEQGWGSNFGSVIEVRSDGLMTPVTDKYAPNYATLIVHALDGAGEPIDGARVLIGLRLNGQVTGDNVGWTDNGGIYEFPIGDGHEYWVAMSTAWGNVEYQMVTENTVGGDEYEVQLQIVNTLPQIEFTEIEMPADDEEDYRLVVEFEADNQVIFGNIVMDDTSENTWFYERREQGAVNFFMCDLVQYFSYISDLPFEAFNSISESDFGVFGFDMPNPVYGSWYAVIDNGNNMINPQWVKGSVALYRWEGTGGTAEIMGVVSDAATGEPIAGAEVSAGAFVTETSGEGEYSLEVYPGNYTVIIDHPLYERVRYENIVLSDEEIYELNGELTDDPIKPLNLTVAGDDDTDAVISWEAPSSLMSRSLQGYRIYRLLNEDEFVIENWEELTAEPIVETSYTDLEWLNQAAGEYRFAVNAQYSECSSDFAMSQALAIYMTAEVTLVLSTNSGDEAAGAEITLENTDGVNSPYNYEFLYPSGDILVMPSIWKGNYQMTIALDNFEILETELTIQEDMQLEFELIEQKPGPGFAGVYEYYLSWDAVPQNREFEEYRIYLDGEEPEIAAVIEPGYDLAEAGLDAGEHLVEIYAFYTSGVSEPAIIGFENGTSLEYGQLAYFPFDEDMMDDISGWTGYSDTVVLTETPFGNGADFNGADYITVPANPELTASALHYTTLFWINAESINTGWRGVIGRPGRNQCVWLNADADYLHHRFHTAGNGTNDGAPNTPNGSFHWDEWNQVAIVNDGNRAKTYINGELLAYGDLQSELIADSTDMYIGKSPDSPTAVDYLYGIMDEVRIWDRGLSDYELRHLYMNEVEILGTGTIAGTITDAANGSPLEGVRLEAGIYQVNSDEDGHFEIVVPARTYDIRFILEDYLVQYENDFTVMADEINELNFTFELTGNDGGETADMTSLIICNYPNPLISGQKRNGGTTFRMFLNDNSAQNIRLGIYNIRGQKIKAATMKLSPGKNEYYWDGNNDQDKRCSAGIYFYEIINQEIQERGKLLILR